MPVKITKVRGGWKVCDPNECFSKKPLDYMGALKQFRAIYISEQKRKKK